ncbi:Sialic acid TRAP transporter small permease protein SiaQ [Moorella humiferrea]|uniref:TRAP transporter small permease n=1 Tax=Neomoorella humiferrea TaxID=676965 RepID=UPI0030CFC8CC
MLVKAKRCLDHVVDWLVILLTSSMVAVSFYQVIMRYVLKNAPSWSEELARYLFVWVVFLGAAIAFRNSSHLGLDYFVNLLPSGPRRVIRYVVGLLLVILLFKVTLEGFSVAELVKRQLSAAMRMPMNYAYLAIPVGSLLMLLEVLWSFFRAEDNGGGGK